MAWYNEKGNNSEVVISSRVRFARNLNGYAFGDRLTDESRSEIIEKVTKALAPAGLETVDLVAKTPVETGILAEKRYISPSFANRRTPHTLLLSEEKQEAVTVCDEDHVRIQAFCPGLALNEAYEKAAALDDLLDGAAEIAYSETIGYMTQNPTDLGTGMRASVVLHLPALTLAGQIGPAARNLAKLGISMRGFAGEVGAPDALAAGALYQLTNAVTMVSETEILEKLTTVAKQLAESETKLRSTLKSDSFARLCDRVMRAYGTLANAYILPAGEFIDLWSDVRLGVVLGILKAPDTAALDSLLVAAMPANLMQAAGSTGDIPASELDIQRAKSVRECLLNNPQ